MSGPRIVRLPDGGVALSFPFQRPLVEALKRSIPAGYRSYDPGDHAWTIAAAYAAKAIWLLQQTFPHAEVIDAGPATGDAGDAWEILHLKDTAPPELVEVAYRCLARLHHPDRGGDHEDMLILNAAYDSLRTALR
jgi:hypothetical protein